MYAGPRGIIMKTTFKLDSLAFTIDDQPVELKGLEITSEASAQEIATSGGNFNSLVEIIGNIAERFNNNKPEIEVKVKEEPVEVKPEPITDFCEIKVKEKTKKPELPTSSWSGGQPKFNLTKAWRAIPVPKSMKQTDVDQYRWEGEKGLLGDSVSVNGATYGVVYIHVYGMKQRCFITVRSGNAKFEDDIRPEDFEEFLSTINIPEDVKEYIRKVVEL